MARCRSPPQEDEATRSGCYIGTRMCRIRDCTATKTRRARFAPEGCVAVSARMRDARVRALARVAAFSEEQLAALLEIVDLVAHRRVSSGTLSVVAGVLQETAWRSAARLGRAEEEDSDGEAERELAARIRSALLEQAVLDSCITAKEVADRLGVSRATIARFAENAVLRLIGPGRGGRYPAWQFEKRRSDRRVRGLTEVLAALEGTPLRKAVWLTTRREVWGGRAASQLLQEGQYLRVVELARADAISV